MTLFALRATNLPEGATTTPLLYSISHIRTIFMTSRHGDFSQFTPKSQYDAAASTRLAAFVLPFYPPVGLASEAFLPPHSIAMVNNAAGGR
jgi:hypothetical protein